MLRANLAFHVAALDSTPYVRPNSVPFRKPGPWHQQPRFPILKRNDWL